MANMRFNEAKATQAACLILRLRGGTMHYLKLVKLLYIADRTSLQELGRPITTDHHVSMNKGPVVSRIYNLISEGVPPGEEGDWHKHISNPHDDFQVSCLDDPGVDHLSDIEEEMIRKVYEEYGYKNRWALCEETHAFPEWKNPDGSMIPISYDEILRAVGRTEDASDIQNELESMSRADAMLS